MGFIYVFTTTSDIRAFPLRKIDAIERLQMLKLELNPCSDHLTSVNSPSSISILQNEYDVNGLYLWIGLIWVWLFLFLANGIWLGIVRHYQFYEQKGEEAKAP